MENHAGKHVGVVELRLGLNLRLEVALGDKELQ